MSCGKEGKGRRRKDFLRIIVYIEENVFLSGDVHCIVYIHYVASRLKWKVPRKTNQTPFNVLKTETDVNEKARMVLIMCGLGARVCLWKFDL